MKLVACAKSEWHGHHVLGEACRYCEPAPAQPTDLLDAPRKISATLHVPQTVDVHVYKAGVTTDPDCGYSLTYEVPGRFHRVVGVDGRLTWTIRRVP